MATQREWFDKDYYKTLGVSKGDSAKDITKAYRKLAREFHPDANPGDEVAEERFKEISAAYDVLGDEAKRKEYDSVRRLGPMGGFAGGAGRGPGARGPGPGGMPFDVSDLGDVGDLGDIIGGMFGRGRQRGGAQGGTGPQRGTDQETDLHLSFHDAVVGVTTTLRLTSEATCSSCRGSGAEPGTTPRTCPTCSGRGVNAEDQGFFSFSSPCQACRGSGQLIDTPCSTCRGTGAEKRPREVKVRIPAGVDTGQKIRLKGRGGPGRNGGPAGDLFVKVAVGKDRRFARKGRDLTITVPVTFTEAALGGELTVPTHDGGTVRVKLPAGTPSGRTLRVKGRGIPLAKGAGDLRVTVEIDVPGELTDEQRAAIESLDAQSDGPALRAHLLTSNGSSDGAE